MLSFTSTLGKRLYFLFLVKGFDSQGIIPKLFLARLLMAVKRAGGGCCKMAPRKALGGFGVLGVWRNV